MKNLNINVLSILESAPENVGKFLTDTVGGIATGLNSFVSALTGFVLAIVTVPFILVLFTKRRREITESFYKNVTATYAG